MNKQVENSLRVVKIGPSHAELRGAIRIISIIEGDIIKKATCEMGYSHRGLEKIGENKTYHQFINYTDKLNYYSALVNNITYVMAVEKLLGVELKERTIWIRMICCELSRIMDHLFCLGSTATCFGSEAFAAYLHLHCETTQTLIEKITGSRLSSSYARVGGMARDLPEDFEKEIMAWSEKTKLVVQNIQRHLICSKTWKLRTVGVGEVSKKVCQEYSISGPNARASGFDADLRRDTDCMYYKLIQFEVPLGKHGDLFERQKIRTEEILQSLDILTQCCKKIKKGDIWTDDIRVKIPNKHFVYDNQDENKQLYDFFKKGISVPSGEVYEHYESPNGELGFYVISRGNKYPHRLRIRSPSFWNYQVLEVILEGECISNITGILNSLNVVVGELDR